MEAYNLSKDTHFYLALTIIIMIIFHILAVVKHYILDKENLLKRMSFFKSLIIILIIFGLTPNLKASEFELLKSESYIEFSGTHAGNKFKGKFNDFDAQINFDFDDVANSKIKIVINNASAETDNKMYDGTLPSKDWFDVENYENSIFESTRIEKENGKYIVIGNLTIRDITKEISYEAIITKLDEHAKGSFDINRLDYKIGKNSDPKAEWVSKNININFAVKAKNKNKNKNKRN